MPASIGVNLRVTGHCRQGGRKYMEDFFSVAYQQTEDEKDLEYAFFGIYDGHGGAEAAAFAKEHLMETIIKHKCFWSENDEDILRAIKDGYLATHFAMWKAQEKWPRTASGLPSTAGTTASVAFIRRGKIYIGHVGDSGIMLGYQEKGSSEWKAQPLTCDHKPENIEEMTRINQCGGKVVSKSGVPRVVWNRPRVGHQGPVRRSTPIDEIPFLAVARSLGDLWSYNSQINQFIVSPDPDCSVVQIDPAVHRCLIFGTDGLFNMLSAKAAVHLVQQAERHNESAALSDTAAMKTWLNPSKLLVEKALERWHSTKMRADNTSVVCLMLDPPGPPRAQVLKNLKKNSYPVSGLKIMTRFEDQECGKDDTPTLFGPLTTPLLDTSISNVDTPTSTDLSVGDVAVGEEGAANSTSENVTSSDVNISPLKERNCVEKPRETTSVDLNEESENKENVEEEKKDCSIQINEISSSCIDDHEEAETRRNLRSGGNSVNRNNDKKKKIEIAATSTSKKRSLVCTDSVSRLRKSSRIDSMNKTNEKIKSKQAVLKKKVIKQVLRKKKTVANLKKKIKTKITAKKAAVDTMEAETVEVSSTKKTVRRAPTNDRSVKAASVKMSKKKVVNYQQSRCQSRKK